MPRRADPVRKADPFDWHQTCSPFVMRDLVGTLGWVVAGALASACDGSSPGTPGRIAPDGTVTSAEPAVLDGACAVNEEATYAFDPAISCELAYSLAKACATKVCQNGETSCAGYDGNRARLFGLDNDGFLEACKSDRTRIGQIVCFKHVRSKDCGAIEGRRPTGLHEIEAAPYVSVGQYFANAAHLEAAAVLAFERLEVELRANSAPRALLGRLRRATRDERRHVEITSALARRFGAEPIAAVADPMRARSLVDIALENVVEGVVRETYGATIALFRAARAQDLGVRAAAIEIAEDECRHAQLSWDLHAWLLARLDEKARAHVENARLAAIEALREELGAEPAPELADLVGVPRPAEARRLFEGVFAHAWHGQAA